MEGDKRIIAKGKRREGEKTEDTRRGEKEENGRKEKENGR